MPTLLTLPREIIYRIFYCATGASCKQLRLASGLTGEIGRKWVFESARIAPLKISCEKFRSILDNPELAGCVTKVYIDTVRPRDDRNPRNQNDPAEFDDGALNDVPGEDDLPRPFWTLVNRLNEFPRLQSVVLSFHHECDGEENDWNWVTQTIAFRHSVLRKTFAILANLPRLPRELAIRNLQNINPTGADVERDIKKVLTGLRSLRLNIANEHVEGNGENDIEKEALHSFFRSLGSTWLEPAAATLEHLTLYSDAYFGFFPPCDLTDMHFPRLKTLALGNYTFMHDSQLDWITSHGETLQELYLDDCPIMYEVIVDAENTHRTILTKDRYAPHPRIQEYDRYASYDKRWADYFRAFNERLPHLRHFRSGHCPTWWRHDDSTPFEDETQIAIEFNESYMTYCDGYGPSPYMESLLWDVQDEEEVKSGICYEDECRLKPSAEDVAALGALLGRMGQGGEVSGGVLSRTRYGEPKCIQMS
ncbi:hypothetical protein BJY00DRAFT_306746 [Aspergillus carlsbadensis]|nr:hypothetical protein BJY00DRAFT_306746 [Aspergillus carlsbadensis]